MKNATIKLVLGNKPLQNGSYNIYLRITKNRRKKEISLGIQCRGIDFENEVLTKSHAEYIEYNYLLSKLKTRAYDIVREYRLSNTDYTLKEFEKKFRGEKDNDDVDVYDFFDELIEEMRDSNRVGNARAYKETKVALMKFSEKPLVFCDITPAFLEKFEASLRAKGNQDGGIAFKMRELRAIFNTAIRRKIVNRDIYPFDLYKISKLKTKTSKRALSIDEVKRFRNLDLSKHPYLIEAHTYFLFSFYLCGINFIDIMKLKWTDIKSGRIDYVRSKTKGRFSIKMTERVMNIVEFYRVLNRDSKYVFPILLHDNLTPIQIENRKHKVLSRCNSRLKVIAKMAHIEKNITFYVARHSFATILKEKGTSTDVISELMGHSNVEITRTYLKDFDTHLLDMENSKLSNL